MAKPKVSVRPVPAGGYSVSFKTKGGAFRDSVYGVDRAGAESFGKKQRGQVATGAILKRRGTFSAYKSTKAERAGAKMATASKQRRDSKGRFA